MIDRQVLNGYVWDIDLKLDDNRDKYILFLIYTKNATPVFSYRFKKLSYELLIVDCMEFFKVKSWNDIKYAEVRIMLDNNVLRAIGRIDEELWMEVYPWNFIEEQV